MVHNHWDLFLDCRGIFKGRKYFCTSVFCIGSILYRQYLNYRKKTMFYITWHRNFNNTVLFGLVVGILLHQDLLCNCCHYLAAELCCTCNMWKILKSKCISLYLFRNIMSLKIKISFSVITYIIAKVRLLN